MNANCSVEQRMMIHQGGNASGRKSIQGWHQDPVYTGMQGALDDRFAIGIEAIHIQVAMRIGEDHTRERTEAS